VVLDNLCSGKLDLVEGAPLVRANVGDRELVRGLFAEHGPFDGILHFAALLSVPESVSSPLAYYENNVAQSLALLDLAIEHGVSAFVLSSTAAVYGHPGRQPIPESESAAPINPYGHSKWMVERMLADAEKAHGLRWAALRYFNACGADPGGGLGECHEPETHLIPICLEAAAGLREQLELYGTDYPTPDGTCIRDYVHVTDLADAHVRALEALLSDRSVGARNVATGEGHSNREVIAAVERVIGKKVPFREAPRRPGDPPVLVADARLFRQEFGWEPRYSDLDTVVRTAWAWLCRWKGIS
jgi:UDP-glucose-4-epimerase GalE